ncbi:MAG: sigma-54 dependent transcriptional regulator [Natronospirillum sp.]|uniref:sigma-54-dependent transcriptional regulator n=1 Tax=Natronospirillum sp. TaxID=2812955 RepID=UPI0025CDD3BC|nr:sigma-54 dependent transcriptional regulator [Natronospirillum sp.]MCH8551352.1 sigma-54 dependent transcriptional regulator [Natronospirillum sp.]
MTQEPQAAKARVLIIDDEPDIRELLVMTLQRMGLQAVEAGTLEDSRRHLGEQTFDLCLTDMKLPDGDGIELVRYLQAQFPRLPVVMITAHGNMETAIEALKAGAFDFLNKPLDLQHLRDLIRSAVRLGKEPVLPGQSEAPPLLGTSPAMEEVRALINKVARSQAPVYISGESGTGKELAARQIHALSARAEQPFVAVNCGAIPRELMESELFGHVKGSFTGAYSDKPGLFRAADGGTLFLDEVAELPLDMQVKLLRVLQEKSIRPVGAAKEQRVDVRLLSATHRDLAAWVDAGRFRQDLFYRLNVIGVHLPPLRERPQDVLVLSRHILNRLASDMDMRIPELTESAADALSAHSFPGNVRELENILERALTLSDGGAIEPEDLQLLPAVQGQSTVMGAAGSDRARQSSVGSDDDLLAAARELGLEACLEDVERVLIRQALRDNDGNRTATARELGISFRALRYRLKKLDLDDE